jgi:ribosomal protein S27E
MGDGRQERECVEYLKCPACQHVDLDFELVDYRVVRCFGCAATVHVTGYQVHLGGTGEPMDHVGLLGEVLLAAMPARGGPG